MPRLRPAKQKADPDNKLFDSAVVKAQEQEEELQHGDEAEKAPPEDNKEAMKAKEEPEIEEKKEEDPALALQKQLDELKKSEEIQRNQREQAIRERDDAIKRAKEREVEVTKFQKEAIQSQYDSISTALTAAQEQAESAKRDIKLAINNSDADLQADAYERLATARANISKLEDGKFEIEARVRADKAVPKQESQAQQTQTQDPLGLDKSNLPDSAKAYLRKYPDLITDPRKNARLQAWHWDAVDAGHEPFSDAYFGFIDEKRQPPQKKEEKQEEQQQQQRTNIVSAPVSREVPSGGGKQQQGGKVTLTPAQQESARISGITDAEYARQLLKLNEAKANGQYTGGQ